MAKLKFGTSGIRSIMNDEPDGMNVHVVKRVSRGLGSYLLNNKKDELGEVSVILGCDSRNNSRLFLETAAETLTKAGIKAKVFPYIVPVPMLSFAIRELKADAGVMITASHNPKEYNGYKVYNRQGNQITDKEAHEIEIEINRDDNLKEEVKSGMAGACVSLYENIPSDFMKTYLNAVKSIKAISTNELDKSMKIVYTPLHGAGCKPVTALMEEFKLNYTLVKEQAKPNGDFPTCPYPNPEIPEVYALALSYAKSIDADMILATDPDSDRLGVAVKVKRNRRKSSLESVDEEGMYRVLTGNEVGTLITKYLLDKGAEGNTIISSIVSTPIIEPLAKAYGKKVERKLVGFKYIGERMNEIGDDFLFGFEESNGFLAGQYTRDKDAVCGTMLISCACGFYKSKGLTLLDVLDVIYEEFGNVVDVAVSVKIHSEEEKNAMMSWYRKELRDGEFSQVDYMDGIDGLPPANMLVRDYKDGSRVIIRPSGTEPKIKMYIYASSEERASELEQELRKQ